MRWGRGFFRLWLFLSVIWIAASVYLVGPKTYSFLWRGPILDFETPAGGHFSLDSSKSRQELIRDITAAVKREVDKVVATLPAGYELEHPVDVNKRRDELLEFVDSKIQETSESAKRAWLATCAPPLVLLGLGLCVAWILRGFRTQKPVSTT
jgi:hypothetical protein